MMSFRGGRLRDFAIPASTVWLMTDIAEAKGRQELFTKQSPQILKALRERALIQSAESSNRIEGVTVDPERLRPLVLGNARPRERSEEEVQNYRVALNLIHSSFGEMSVSVETLQRLHKTIQSGAVDAGKWKQVKNDIIEFRTGAPPVVRFRPVSVAETPGAVEELCLAYRSALDQDHVPPLLATAALILDYLCIHPFRDGNGRVSRLLTLLALYHHSYSVGRYISLEQLVEQAREAYYEALRRSSSGWHEGMHELLPWLNFFLAILHRAYKNFEERAGQVKSPRGAKRALIHEAIAAWTGEFTLVELERACPGISRDMIRRVLRELQKAEQVNCLGRGPGARWRKRGNNLK